MDQPKKSLGQHWLKDASILSSICGAAELSPQDTVLEIGSGQGHLTAQLLNNAGKVVAVELDADLAAKLPADPKLRVVQADILKFDLNQLPTDYKVVANIPYYLTSNLIRVLSESSNPPSTMVLLVQKEVAQRLTAKPGQMSLLGVSAQLYYRAELGLIVKPQAFDPPPKVDSQVIILKRHDKPLFEDLDTKIYFKLVKAGFSGRRKKLRSSLAAGLHIDKAQSDKLLASTGLNNELRAQNLSLEDWHSIYLTYMQQVYN